MKTIIAMAATLAALTTMPSFAQEAGGQYEWQSRQVPGPNKSGIATRVRVWVADKPEQMANCDCAMMKADATGCMQAMPGQHVSPPRS
jgi:uncharacterized membrane protein YdfJ with MMPL/SSD domain